MTQKEQIAALQAEVAKLREQVTELAIALATRPAIQYVPYPAPAPTPAPQPFQPWSPTVTPWTSPNTCTSGITITGASGLQTYNWGQPRDGDDGCAGVGAKL